MVVKFSLPIHLFTYNHKMPFIFMLEQVIGVLNYQILTLLFAWTQCIF